HDFADLFEMRVKEALFMMGQTPFGHDRAAAADNSASAFGGERDVTKQHASMNRKVIDTLLALLDERVAIDFPAQFFSATTDFFQGLINRHSTDGHGGVAQDPFAGLVNVFAGGKVHDGIRAPFSG